MAVINGKNCADAVGKTISQYLEMAEYKPSQVAVEKNLEIVSKADYDSTIINENDVIEVVTFMGGGC
jgi:sulfur carrier protein